MRVMSIFFVLFCVVGLAAYPDTLERGITPFMRICHGGTAEEVEVAIKAGGEVNGKTWVYRRVPLDFAVFSATPDRTIKVLLENGADPTLSNNALYDLINRLDDRSEQKNIEDAIFLLLERGGNWNYTEALTYAAARCRNLDIIRKLIELGADINGLKEIKFCPTPVGNANLPVLKLLLESGADPNQRYNYSYAYSPHSNEHLALLIKYGMDFSLINKCFAWAEPRPVDLWSEWISPEHLEFVIAKGCNISKIGMRGAAKNPYLPEIFDTLSKLYGRQPPLKEMAEEAVRYGSTRNLQFMLDKGAVLKPMSPEMFFNGVTNARGTSDQIKEDKLRILLEMIPDPNEIIPQYKKNTLAVCAEWGVIREAELLLKNGIKVDWLDPEGRTAMHFLMASHYLKGGENTLEFLKLLLEHGANINNKDKDGVTPLHLALSQEQQPETVRYMIEQGADIKAATRDGITPLMLAARYYRSDILELMIAKGAEVNVCDKGGWSPLFYAAWNNFPEFKRMFMEFIPLETRHRSVEDGNVNIVTLLKSGARADIVDIYGAGVLSKAAAWATRDTLKQLYDIGGSKSLHAVDECNFQAIHYAAAYNENLDAVEFLLEQGADPNKIAKRSNRKRHENFWRVNCSFTLSTESNMATDRIPGPLFVAVRRWNVPLIKLLLKYGADPKLEYAPSCRPYNYWPLSNEIKDIFSAAGVDFNAPETLKETKNFRNFMASYQYLSPGEIKSIYEKLAWSPVSPSWDIDFRSAACYGTLEEARYLAKITEVAMSTVFVAAGNLAHPEVLEYMVEQKPEALRHIDEDGNSLLHYAASPRMVDFLVAKGLDINLRNQKGQTPLIKLFDTNIFLAYQDGKYDIAEALLRHGADINAADTAGNTAIGLARDTRRWGTRSGFYHHHQESSLPRMKFFWNGEYYANWLRTLQFLEKEKARLDSRAGE